MRPRQENSSDHQDRSVLVFLIGILLFVSPLTLWWAANTRLWYLPYAMWLVMIVLIAWVVSRGHDDI